MNRRIGKTGLKYTYMTKLWTIALGSAALSFAVKLGMTRFPPLFSGAVVLSIYGFLYFASSAALGIPDARRFFKTFRKYLNF